METEIKRKRGRPRKRPLPACAGTHADRPPSQTAPYGPTENVAVTAKTVDTLHHQHEAVEAVLQRRIAKLEQCVLMLANSVSRHSELGNRLVRTLNDLGTNGSNDKKDG